MKPATWLFVEGAPASRPASRAAAGQVLEFRDAWHARRYGPTATVIGRFTSVDRPHPGRVHRDWVDLVTANGTRLQWQAGKVSRAFRRIARPVTSRPCPECGQVEVDGVCALLRGER